jgi:hypothetical protein
VSWHQLSNLPGTNTQAYYAPEPVTKNVKLTPGNQTNGGNEEIRTKMFEDLEKIESFRTKIRKRKKRKVGAKKDENGII